MERFCIDVIAATPNPQQVVWAAMHQDYSEDYVWNSRDRWPPEERSGELIVKHLLAGERGHYGCLEHPQITFNVGYFPHSMMQQVRTHRVGVSFDVQCLAANTHITFVNDNGETSKELRTTIGELYERWTNGEKNIPQKSILGINEKPYIDYQCEGKNRIFKMYLRVLNEENGLFETGHIKDVIFSGIQPVYRVTLADGKTLDCTVNHRLLTSAGWQTMGDAVGLITSTDGCVVKLTKPCSVMCNGIAVASNTESSQWQSQRQSAGTNIKAHPVKVTKVEYLGKHKTYDLEVDGQWHNFVANGMVVHNSFRYTGQRIINVAQGKQDIEEVFYLRPVGNYTNRQGKRYFYSEAQRSEDIKWCLEACKRYQQRIEEGLSEEHARGLIPFDARQNFVLSCNMRSLMHLLDLRWKKDAQLEAQKFCELLYLHFEKWSPAVAKWYKENRAKKAKLSP
ncbi:MAG: FAD-dependent thymidylate synthase [Coleofasciculus sp. G1-WW12-02]|uniref:FAD-dependent thymidylate synthase n=1 Tax=Coleofasciculus sp. G1-WW12-02 TaxID=3068483 RepID=UPI0032F6F19B